MDVTFTAPGTTEPSITVRRPGIGRISVLVDGVPARRIHSRALSYEIPFPDGVIKEMRLTGQWTGLKAVIDGSEIPLERPTRPYERVLTFLPFILVIGGILGALIAVGASALNARLARMRWPALAGPGST